MMLPIRLTSEFSPIFREFERFFGEEPWVVGFQRDTAPLATTSQDQEAYHVTLDVPGFTEKDLQVDVHRGVLTISGQRSVSVPDGAKAIRRERGAHSFTKSLSLPDAINEDDVVAKVRDGVLTVSLPKREEVKPRRIAVSVH